jgi:cytochrome c-type biogenesis protein CcmH
MRFLYCLLAIFFLVINIPCFALTTDSYSFISPQQQLRFTQLIAELRCLVCQNQSLAESNAPLAQDLRHEVYLQLQHGAANEQIKKYLAQRYGDYILFKPSFNRSTYVLWVGPFLVLAISFMVVFWQIKKQSISRTLLTTDCKQEYPQ